LLDTHVLIWALDDSPRLGVAARNLLEDAENEHWVSAASIWEIAIKASIRKLTLSRPLREIDSSIHAAGFRVLDVTIRHAAAVSDVEIGHSDPFDRLLLAQCEVETLRLLTADEGLAEQPGVIAV
jgi:PIN domain nuclease of toxin-antitoxin system